MGINYVLKVDYEKGVSESYKGVVVFSRQKKKEITRLVSSNFMDDLREAEKVVVKENLILYEASVEQYAREIGILKQGENLVKTSEYKTA